MNGDFVVLMDKKNKPKKCVVNDKNKVLYVKKNKIDFKYVKHNNKFILKNEYAKLCNKKTKKMRGGNGDNHIAWINDEGNLKIIVNKNEINDESKKNYIIIKYKNESKKDCILYFCNNDDVCKKLKWDKDEANGVNIVEIWSYAILINMLNKSIILLAKTKGTNTDCIKNKISEFIGSVKKCKEDAIDSSSSESNSGS